MEHQGPDDSTFLATANLKKNDYLPWDDYLMGIACLAAKRSKDPVTQVGAVIVTPDNRIISVGYNGMPIGCSDDTMPWGKHPVFHQNKHFYVCHAEMNAIVLAGNCGGIKGYKLYVTLFPCNECTKIIVQAGIKNVVYLKRKPGNEEKDDVLINLMESLQIVVRQYQPMESPIVIDWL